LHRRKLLTRSPALLYPLVTNWNAEAIALLSVTTPDGTASSLSEVQTQSVRLHPPNTGAIKAAFVISQGAVVIDFCGPWEVFNNAVVPGRTSSVFETYTVAETLDPVQVSGGMVIVPKYTFDTAPPPNLVVIPAQHGATAKSLQWIETATNTSDVTMSVCVGSFTLADTGLLNGRSATTFHEAYDRFAAKYPAVHLKRGKRFVEDGNLASAGGLSSGIDLAIRVIERYFGREAAEQTAYRLEYQGLGWTDANSNKMYDR
jgi:transcriptional regulator GlxA family with amidase domain